MVSLGFPVALVPVLHLEGHHRHRLDRHLVHHLHHQVQPGLVQLLLQVPVLGIAQFV